ncbi:hypothetical protein [Aeromonas eucrenophila]|uniref:Uncharacterized protein n=1 Tax=Aeromonas eucrenophila TaxID=649 RepID=A0ABW0YCT2_9GAMM|nr:hypothetical protein [Aeromonas eucrenophila]
MKPQTRELANHFVRGAVAGGLISALQGGTKPGKVPGRKILRHSLQGGLAVATGLGVANALEQGQLSRASLLLIGGVVGIASTEQLLNHSKE